MPIDNAYHKRAKILIMIPVMVFAVTSLCLMALTMSYLSTGSDTTAVALIFAGTLCLILTALPCLVMAIVGTVFAAKAKKEGIAASGRLFVIGIIEIAIYGPGVMGALLAAIITITRW